RMSRLLLVVEDRGLIGNRQAVAVYPALAAGETHVDFDTAELRRPDGARRTVRVRSAYVQPSAMVPVSTCLLLIDRQNFWVTCISTGGKTVSEEQVEVGEGLAP